MDSSEILISIIIPCWNSSNSITKAVHSVTNQLKKNYEIVIIDDASEDDTWQVLKKLHAQHNEIKIIRNKTNKGPSASRNYGIKISQGKFVGFLDSDDYFKSGFLSKVVESLRFCEADIVKFGILQTHHYGGRLRKKILASRSFYSDKKEEIIPEAVYLETLPILGFVTNGFYSSLFLKNYGILFEEDQRFAEDFFLILRHWKNVIPSNA